MTFDYTRDLFGSICLHWAKQCKTDVGFGAVLVKDKTIIGMGRNRLANAEERACLKNVDYAIHAEQAAIVDSLRGGFDPRGADLFVLGICLHGKNKGALTTRTERIFVCRKCPASFVRFDITVFIPHMSGWKAIAPYEVEMIGKANADKGYWKKFVATPA